MLFDLVAFTLDVYAFALSLILPGRCFTRFVTVRTVVPRYLCVAWVPLRCVRLRTFVALPFPVLYAFADFATRFTLRCGIFLRYCSHVQFCRFYVLWISRFAIVGAGRCVACVLSDFMHTTLNSPRTVAFAICLPRG